jgi:hypothetical protein
MGAAGIKPAALVITGNIAGLKPFWILDVKRLTLRTFFSR